MRVFVAVALFVGALLFAGCSGGARPASTQAPARPAAGLEEPQPDPGFEGEGEGSDPAATQAAQGPLIVYTGSLSLEVADLRSAIDQATALVTGMGGHIAQSHEENVGGRQSASVTYRIPAHRWAEAVGGLRALGQKVLREDTNAQDVTAQVVDLDARIANLRASESALQQIMATATTIPDVLRVQDELSAVRGEIESMTAQRNRLADQAALGTLTLSFNTPAMEAAVASGGWDLGREIDGAVATLVRLGQGLASLGVWVAIVALPVALPLLLIGWLAVRVRRRYLARADAPPVRTG